MSSHAKTAAHRDLYISESRYCNGPFGRLFRNLPPWIPTGATEEKKLNTIAILAEQLLDDDGSQDQLDNERIPAGYTYFGQFLDHDITFDPTSSLQRANDPDHLHDFRTPRLDLDSLYGRGREDQPYLYRRGGADGLFILGKNSQAELDLQRNRDSESFADNAGGFNQQDRALIGDPRNDENIIVSQFQLAMLKIHNKQVESGKSFDEAARFLRWHYQWVVIQDFLRRLCGDELIDEILSSGCPGEPELCFYAYDNEPFMPVEFSGAAYRLGHSMVRPEYHLSDKLQNLRGGKALVIFGRDPKDDLRGFRMLPGFWAIQWDRFVSINGSTPQLSRLIDTHVATGLRNLPLGESDPRFNSLAFRNILRGWRLGLPSGQSVAKRMGIVASKILPGNDPLWIYVLKEAERGHDGKRLGPVGGRIVAEVLIGLVASDPSSYLATEPNWTPEKKDFDLADLLQLSFDAHA